MKTGRRLNLLAFPTETNALFALLMLAGLMLAIFLGYVLVSFWNSSATSIDPSLQAETVLASFLPVVCISATMAGVIFGAALLAYRRHPGQVRRRKKLAALEAKDQAIQQAVSQMAAQAGVAPAPVVEMPPGLGGASGQAFGVGGRYILRLDGGLRLWRRTKPALFRAVVFHELAHIANRDIWRSYFSDALWRAILICSLLPLILLVGGRFVWNSLSSLLGGDLLPYLIQAFPALVKIFLQSALTVAVITLVWMRLLRTREFYADWQAARWGAEEALKVIFRGAAGRETPPRRLSLRRLHPSASQRLALLDQPGNLFRISKVLTFVVGFLTPFVLLGVFFAGFSSFLILQAPLRLLREASEGWLFWLARGAWFLLFFAFLLIAFAPLAWLVSGVLGAQIQRQAARDLVERRRGVVPYLRLVLPALLLVAGAEVGAWVVPLDLLSPNNLMALALRFLLLISQVFLAWWFMIYIRFASLRLFAGYSGAGPPVWRIRLIAWSSSVWLFLFFLPGLILIQLMTSSTPGEAVFLYTGYGFLGWLTFVLVFSPLFLAASWAAITALSALQDRRCPACGQIILRPTPALEACEHCGKDLREWLFVPEGILPLTNQPPDP